MGLTQSTVLRDVPLKQILLDDKVQMRQRLDQAAVQDYADAMEAGAEFPPVIVFHRAGGPMYCADGFHRILAARKLKRPTIRAEVRDGGRREAVLYAAGANAAHGVRRTNADKQRAVTALLLDKEWVKWSDTELAKRAAVDRSTVTRYRELLGKERDLRVYIDSKGRLRDVSPRGSGKLDQRIDERVRQILRDNESYKEPKEPAAPSTAHLSRCPYCGHALP